MGAGPQLVAEVKLVTHNWELKLLAIVLAASLWFFVMAAEKADIVLAVPLELHSVPRGLEVVGHRPDSVEVQLTGLRANLSRLGPEHVRARLSLAGVRPGEVALRLLPEQVEVPRGVTAARINPSTVRVSVEPSSSARVKVLPRLSGVLPPGHRVASVRVIPDEVEVQGPASAVSRIAQVSTEPVDISGGQGTVERTAAIVAMGDAVRVTGSRTARVLVEVRTDPSPPSGTTPPAGPAVERSGP